MMCCDPEGLYLGSPAEGMVWQQQVSETIVLTPQCRTRGGAAPSVVAGDAPISVEYMGEARMTQDHLSNARQSAGGQ